MLERIDYATGKTNQFYLKDENSLLLARSVKDFTFGRDGKVYVAIRNRVYEAEIYSRDSVLNEIYFDIYQSGPERINCLKFDYQNQLWIGTDKGLFIVNPAENSLTLFDLIDYPDQKYIRDFLFDHKGNIWIAFYNKLVQYQFQDKSTTTYSIPGVKNPVITSIYQTRNHCIWIGTLEQGLFYKSDS